MSFQSLITPNSVREVINTALTDNEINGLIAAASTLVLSTTRDCFVDPDSEVEMTRWVAAHFVAIKSSMLSTKSSGSSDTFATSVMKEKVGDASIEYGKSSHISTSSSMVNLRSTMWGQTAIMFDPSGKLGSLGGRPPAVVALTDV